MGGGPMELKAGFKFNPSRRPLLHIMQGKVGDGPAATAAATELKNLGIQVGHGLVSELRKYSFCTIKFRTTFSSNKLFSTVFLSGSETISENFAKICIHERK
jgi:hypothetical protein